MKIDVSIHDWREYTEMLKFMDYVVYAFEDAAGWNRDNSYSSLTATSDGIYYIAYACNARVDV